MIITYYGLECFKIQYGEMVVAVNPIAKESSHKTARFGADIALVGAMHPDYNGTEQVSSNGKDTFVVSGPGEYEAKGITIKGFLSESATPKNIRTYTTLYGLTLEGMQLVFLNGISTKILSGDTSEGFGDIDILFVPIGGEGVLAPADAYSLAVSLEPRIIIPMHWDDPKMLQTFLKEGGVEGLKPLDKLTIKQKDLAEKEGEIIVLASS